MSAFGLRLAYVGGEVKLRWWESNDVEIPDDVDEARINYLAFSWGDACEATFTPRPGLALKYKASIWPFIPGKVMDLPSGEP